MTRRLLIDGDAVLYRVAASLQNETWWDDHTRTVTMDVERAVRECDAEIARLKERAKAEVVFVFIGPSDKSQNFRRKLWPAYKAHRRSADVPVGLGELRKKMQACSQWCVVEAMPGFEADDTIAEYATKCEQCHDSIVWSPDKDLLQVPGWHMDDDRLWQIRLGEAEYWHMWQTLVGDSSDGYPGCPGVGPVNAAKVLLDAMKEYPEACDVYLPALWEGIVKAYEKKGLTEQDALVQARVARILRAGERPGEWLPVRGLIRNV